MGNVISTLTYEIHFDIINKIKFVEVYNMIKLTPYREVAKRALINWNGLTEEEAEKLVSAQTFQELENKVWAKNSITYAVQSIGKTLNYTEEETNNFLIAVLSENNVSPSKIDDEIYKKVKSALMLKVKDVDEFIIGVLSDIHDGWVKDNVKKFNQAGRENKRYQHLPIEMIGWQEAKADLLFLDPILSALKIKYDEQELKKAYEYISSNFFEKHNLIDQNNEIDFKELKELIKKGNEFYPAFNQDNINGFNKEDLDKVASEMAKQVGDKTSFDTITNNDGVEV